MGTKSRKIKCTYMDFKASSTRILNEVMTGSINTVSVENSSKVLFHVVSDIEYNRLIMSDSANEGVSTPSTLKQTSIGGNHEY